MPLRIKPHTLLVRAPDATRDDIGRVNVLGNQVEAVEVHGNARPLGAEDAYKAFGVETSEAYRIFVDIPDAEVFLVGALVQVASLSLWLKVAAPPSKSESSPLTAHAIVLCQKTTPPEDA